MDKASEIEENQIVIINNIQSPQEKEDPIRTLTMYGDVTEQKAADVVAALLYMQGTSERSYLKNPENPDSKVVTEFQPIKLYISTHGGSASEMFSVYDVMRMIQKETCEISTYGIGKVMSAGVPILSCGTKGKRFIGKNCRVMLHNVMGGYQGNIFSLENELDEIKWIQERYIECLVKNTNLTKRNLKKILKSQTDVYISANQAIKYGIADKII